jgi:hypothetical protein
MDQWSQIPVTLMMSMDPDPYQSEKLDTDPD